MSALQIPPVELAREVDGELRAYDGSPSNALIAWDLPLIASCTTVRDVEGSPVPPVTMQSMGFVVTRVPMLGGSEEAFDSEAGDWVLLDTSAPPPDAMDLQALEPVDLEDPATGWKGEALAADPRRYVRLGGGYPMYSVRCFFEAIAADGTTTFGWSEPAIALPLAAGTSLFAGVEMEDAKPPKWIRMFLLGDSREERGEVMLRRDTDEGIRMHASDSTGKEKARVVLAEAGHVDIASQPTDASRKASIVLHEDGRIEVTAAPGQRVLVNGIEIERVGATVEVRSSSSSPLVLRGAVRVEGSLHLNGLPVATLP